MIGESASLQRKSAHSRAFGRCVRTGQRLTTKDWLALGESKFNHNHDPANGQFASGPGGAGLSRVAKRHAHAGAPHKPKPPMGDAEIAARANRAMGIYKAEVARGKSPSEAAAWAATGDAESFSNPHQSQSPHGPGRGLFQWGSNIPAEDRRIAFEKIERVPIEHSTVGQQLHFRDWELSNTHRAAKDAIAASKNVDQIVRAITIHYTAPKDKTAAIRDRTNIAKAILRTSNTVSGK